MAVSTPKIPVILITWNNLDFETHQLVFGQNDSTPRNAVTSDINDLLNGSNYSYPKHDPEPNPTGSVQEYFKAISHDRMVPVFEIVSASTSASPTTLNQYAYNIDAVSYTHLTLPTNREV